MADITVSQSKEVRFAVVMYGGVSLAIYINGVAQELYNLVRATAVKKNPDNTNSYLFPDEELKGASIVYRKLGKMLKSRFVVDILSGTSAGGINAVFLAKALANGETLDQIKELWINEGDIGVLVNDRESKVEGLDIPKEPASLLNSQRMLFKLLYALDTMEPDQPSTGGTSPGRSPYVEELDLFVTATDIRGLIQKTNLVGSSTEEYRYKNVFRFHYSTEEAAGGQNVNDFVLRNNPFLAFAARCTSAFPFAFEPMRLDDIEKVVDAPTFKKKYKYAPALWKDFYKDYLPTDQDKESGKQHHVEFEKRSFGDGGYLDNKPFSYVTETLKRRRADLPVDRKLIYIEPAPEHPSEKDIDVRPDALQNVAAALLTLPRYETIREDLQLIMDRNRMIERVGAIMNHIRHVTRRSLTEVQSWQLDGPKWANLYLSDEVLDWYGPGYAAYHQLRVASVLDDLGSGLIRAMGFEENSDLAHTFRHKILEGWREAYYRTDPKVEDQRKSENDLLFRLDISWRIRRLQFMQNVIDSLLAALPKTSTDTEMEQPNYQENLKQASRLVHDSGGEETDWPFTGDANMQYAYRHLLLWTKVGFNEAYKDLRSSGRKIRSRSLLASLGKNIEDKNLLLYAEQLRALKEAIVDNAEEQTIYAHLERLSEALASREAKPKIKGAVRSMISDNSYWCKTILGTKPAPAKMPEPFELDKTYTKSLQTSTLENALATIRACLQYYYDRYEYYDMLTFPLFFGTDVGESDVVEIIRISPEEATQISWPPPKLAGTKLANFGAFFMREWRENDILWGRLDGAECLIKALLPEAENENTRRALIDEAHQAILQEYYLELDQKELFKAMQSTQTTDSSATKLLLLAQRMAKWMR